MLLHGLLVDAAMWEQIAHILKPLRVITPQLPREADDGRALTEQLAGMARQNGGTVYVVGMS